VVPRETDFRLDTLPSPGGSAAAEAARSPRKQSMTSPYLERPLRTLEEALADIAKAKGGEQGSQTKRSNPKAPERDKSA
jgi:hypothetical protein